jgi:opacity protein-like surface antigen
MRKITLVTAIALASGTAIAQEENKYYGGMASDGDKRHQLNIGYRINKTFSIEASYNEMGGDSDKYTNHYADDSQPGVDGYSTTSNYSGAFKPTSGSGGYFNHGNQLFPDVPNNDLPPNIDNGLPEPVLPWPNPPHNPVHPDEPDHVDNELPGEPDKPAFEPVHPDEPNQPDHGLPEGPAVDEGHTYHERKTVRGVKAAMLWGKTQYELTKDVALYSRVGFGRINMDIDTYGITTQNHSGATSVVRKSRRSHYDWGYGLAAGVELAVTDNLYTTLEYQHVRSKKMGDMRHSEGGATFGIGYKF